MSFSDGPFSPIYGFGAIFIILFVSPFKTNIFLSFILATIICSTLEYLTSYFSEKFFKINWWNYSKKPLNINGRICLEYSLYWGTISTLALTFLHPSIAFINNFLSHYLGFFGVIIFTFYFIIDITNTLNDLLRFKKILSHHLEFNLKNNQKVVRLIKSFPDTSSKIYNDIILELKSKLK